MKKKKKVQQQLRCLWINDTYDINAQRCRRRHQCCCQHWKFPIDSLFVKMVFNEFFLFFSFRFCKCFYLFMLTFTQMYYIKRYCFQIWLILIGILLFSFLFFSCFKTINNFAEIHWWKFINMNAYKMSACAHTHTHILKYLLNLYIFPPSKLKCQDNVWNTMLHSVQLNLRIYIAPIGIQVNRFSIAVA